MSHSDDNGLVLPPEVAPIQVVIVPVAMNKPGVLTAAREVEKKFKDAGYRVKLDDSDKSPGWKVSEWEMKGVPMRVELGPRDIEKGQVVFAKRNTGEKIICPIDEMIDTLLIIPTRKLATTIIVPDVKIVVIDPWKALVRLVSLSFVFRSSRYFEV